MKMILILLFISGFLLGVLNLKNAKCFKKRISEELMPIAWHPKRWRDLCMPEDKKKEIELIFLRSVKVCVGSIQYRGIETFWNRKLCISFFVWFFGQNVLNQSSAKIWYTPKSF